MTEITGIAGRRAARLSPWGILTCLDLARADRRLVRSLLTAAGEALWWELNGETVQPIHTRRRAHKALSRGGSFGESTAEPVVLYAWLIRNLERLIEELEYHGVAAGRITVWLAYKNGQVRRRPGHAPGPERPVRRPARGGPALPPQGVDAPRPGDPHAPDRRASSPPAGSAPLGLFDPPGARRAEAVARLKREVNARHGRFVLRSAATLPLAGIYRDTANEYDICDIRGKLCF